MGTGMAEREEGRASLLPGPILLCEGDARGCVSTLLPKPFRTPGHTARGPQPSLQAPPGVFCPASPSQAGGGQGY